MTMESLGTILQRIAAGSYSLPPDAAARYVARSGDAERASSADCERCGGAGWTSLRVPVDHPDFGKIRECACQDTEERRTRRYASLLKYSELPTLNRPAFEDLRQVEGFPNLQHAAAYVEQWCEHPAGFLLLMGDVGTGKTHCAISAGYRLMGQGKVVYFTTAVGLLDAIRAAHRRQDEEDPYALLDKMNSVDVLIVDDLGKQRDTDFAHDRLSTIFAARHAARLITIVTTNLSVDELGVWDSSIASRLFDRSMSITVPMHGPDFRRMGER